VIGLMLLYSGYRSAEHAEGMSVMQSTFWLTTKDQTNHNDFSGFYTSLVLVNYNLF